jgi:hypothetical protein
MQSAKKSWGLWTAISMAVLALLLSCTTDRTTKPAGNLPPETHLYLIFSDTLQLPSESASMQVLHWYGDDPDGEVIGYDYRWSFDTSWTFTTDVSDTFLVPIRVPHDTFSFEVRAVDNLELRDPTPAHLSFPVKNSSPTVKFPVDFMRNYSRSIYNCFSYFSIGWTGSDPDGDATITGYDYYLADDNSMPIDSITHLPATPTEPPHDSIFWREDFLNSSNWVHLDSLKSYKVFDNLQPGIHRLFMRCHDVASAFSNIIYYPDSTGRWNSMPVVGSALLVDVDQFASAIDSVIPNSLNSIYGAGNYSTWTITSDTRLSYYPRDIEATLKLFNVVIWHGGSYPQYTATSDPILQFLAAGHHLLAFSTQRYEGDTTIYPFLPIDTVTTARIGRSFRIIKVPGVDTGYPDTLSSNDPGFPSYPLSKSFGFKPGSPTGLMPGAVRALYTQSADNNPARIDTVAARYPAGGPAQVIYFSMELYLCQSRFSELMNFIIRQEFGDAPY